MTRDNNRTEMSTEEACVLRSYYLVTEERSYSHLVLSHLI